MASLASCLGILSSAYGNTVKYDCVEQLLVEDGAECGVDARGVGVDLKFPRAREKGPLYRTKNRSLRA